MTAKRLSDALDGLAATPDASEQPWRPRTEYDHTSGGYLQTGPLEQVPADHAELLRQFGYDPAEVKIVGPPRISKWQVWRRKDDGPTWLTAYRFAIAPIGAVTGVADLEAIVRKARKAPKPGAGPHTFVYQCSDTQIGKLASGGGVQETVALWASSIEAARAEFRSLRRHGIEAIQISLPGDCVEGQVSQSGRNLGFLTTIPVPEQTRILRRMMMLMLEQFAPLVDRVYLDVVPGNHDQNQRQLNSWPGDNWATETAVAVDDALKLNATAYGHVSVRIPHKWTGHMTVPVGEDSPTVVCIAHGHQWRRGRGMDWWAQQAHNLQAPGAAQVLQCGHHHEWHIESSKSKVLIQSSTLDGGSDWYRERTGAEARRGALVYLLRDGEVSRMSVL